MVVLLNFPKEIKDQYFSLLYYHQIKKCNLELDIPIREWYPIREWHPIPKSVIYDVKENQFMMMIKNQLMMMMKNQQLVKINLNYLFLKLNMIKRYMINIFSYVIKKLLFPRVIIIT